MTKVHQTTSENIANALRKKRGNVAKAADALKINRSTIYRRIQAEPELATVLDDAREERVDVAEEMLDKLVRKGNVTAIIWTLKASPAAKARGWGEKNEVEHDGEVKTRIVIEYADVEIDAPQAP